MIYKYNINTCQDIIKFIRQHSDKLTALYHQQHILRLNCIYLYPRWCWMEHVNKTVVTLWHRHTQFWLQIVWYFSIPTFLTYSPLARHQPRAPGLKIHKITRSPDPRTPQFCPQIRRWNPRLVFRQSLDYSYLSICPEDRSHPRLRALESEFPANWFLT